MKSLNLFGRPLLMLATVVAVAMSSSCKEEPEAIKADITLDSESINVSKIGVDYNGQTPAVEVTSNVYWTLSITTDPVIDYEDEGTEPWVNVSTRAGSGKTTVKLHTLANTLTTPRKAVLTFRTLDGTEKTFTLNQSSDDETIVFLADDFGTATADMASIEEYDGWRFSGVGVDAPVGAQFAYSGTAHVNGSNASSGYEGASGGNNIVLSDEGGELVLNYFRPSSEVNFALSFGSATAAADFDTSKLTVEFSSDSEYWVNVPYTRSAGAAWEHSTIDFTLDKPYSYLYIRFVSDSDTAYQIDDILITDGPGGDEFNLVKPEFKEASLPVSWYMTSAQYANKEGEWFNTLNYLKNSYYILSNTSASDVKPQGPSSISYVFGNKRGTGWNTPEVQLGTTGQPYTNNMWIDDYWLFSVPFKSLEAGMIVSVSFLTRSSKAGMKYFALEYYDNGQWFPASELLEAEEDNSIKYTHAMLTDNSLVSVKFVKPSAIFEDYLQVRFRCVGAYSADGTLLTATSTGTHRIAADTTDKIWPTIDIIDPKDQPEKVTFTLTGVGEQKDIILPGSATIRPFKVKADWDWTLSTSNLEWATVTPTKGGMDATVEVTIDAEENDGQGRFGKIILKSGTTEVEVMVFQSAAGGGDEEKMEDDGQEVGYVYFEDAFDWIKPFKANNDIALMNESVEKYQEENDGNYPTKVTLAGTSNMYTAKPEGYEAGDLAKEFAAQGYTDINPTPKVIYFGEHYMKFGKTDYQSGITRTIPNTVIDKGTNIRMSFDATTCITGSANYDDVAVLVTLEGPGSVDVNDGTTKTSAEIAIRQESKTFPWLWNSREVILYGVTSETIVTLKTNKSGSASGVFRFYLDNLKFEKHSKLQ